MTTSAVLESITLDAHQTFHPGQIDWTGVSDPVEFDFCSRMAFEQPGHEQGAIAYLTKELAQLAEIERHVSTVMALALCEMQRLPGARSGGVAWHHALSCFAAEELQHANTFYRYVRELSGWDPRVADPGDSSPR